MSTVEQVALVTGAGHGIGQAVALRLAAAGCRVAAVARSDGELAGTVAAAAGAAVLPVAADVTRDAALEQAVRLIIERLGRITVLVNNAGWAPPRDTVLKSSLGDWDRTLATCLRAPMVLTRLVLPDMLAHAHGTLINLASIAGRHGRAGEAAYAAAKLGLLGFTQALRAEVAGHGITVAAVRCGPVAPPPDAAEPDGDGTGYVPPQVVADAVADLVAAGADAAPAEIVLEPARGAAG